MSKRIPSAPPAAPVAESLEYRWLFAGFPMGGWPFSPDYLLAAAHAGAFQAAAAAAAHPRPHPRVGAASGGARPVVVTGGTGLTGEYFEGSAFQRLVMVR